MYVCIYNMRCCADIRSCCRLKKFLMVLTQQDNFMVRMNITGNNKVNNFHIIYAHNEIFLVDSFEPKEKSFLNKEIMLGKGLYTEKKEHMF